jgi:hypothetical protein
MRCAILFFIFSFFTLLACTVKKVGTEQPKPNSRNPAQGSQAMAFDSTVYIGPVNYFEDTKEFFTPLYYSEEVNADEAYGYLSKAVDSLLSSENGVNRKRLPYETAQWFFKMEGMSAVSLFNAESKKLGDADLVRIELHQNKGGEQFIAVYKPRAPLSFTTSAVYCASASETNLNTVRIKYEYDRNELVTKLIFDKFDVSENRRIKHANLRIYNSVYSTLDLDSVCLLLEVHGNEIQVVHESKEDYCISKLLPTHFQINGKPVLITSMSVRNSDVMWTSLAVFTGRRYEFAQRCRVKVR